MQLNRKKVLKLMETYCNGNYNGFARELSVDPSHLYRFLNKGVGGGTKIIGAVIIFCKRRGIEYEEYIEF